MISKRTLLKLLSIAVLTFAAISPLVQIVGAPFFFDNRVILHSKADPALRSFLAKVPTTNSAEVSVLLVFSNTPSTQQLLALRELGTVETFTGHVATMHLPVNMLPQVASLDFVSRVSRARILSAKLDASVPEILADKVWETVQDSAGNAVNGTGVVIGIIDTGIDLTHRDFFFENGTSKILFLWDQSVNGNHPQGYDYGNECSRTMIESRTCNEIDGDLEGSAYLGTSTGHGTAVAAVAASSGQSANLLQSCLRYDGITWHDDAQLCQDSYSPFVLLAGTSDTRYFGNSRKFNQLFFDVQSGGIYGNFVWEYSQGSGSWGTLNPVDSNQTSGFAHSGTVFFTPPANWMPDTIDGRAAQYWVRVKTPYVGQQAVLGHIQANPPYRGVAPGALLIPVKLKDGGDDSIIDGVNYIVGKARQLGLPFVINHSFGDSLGSHDGTGPLELAYSDFASNGVPIVVVAGQDRNANLHVSGRLKAGQSVTVPWSTEKGLETYVDLWYPVTDDLGISVRTPTGTVVSGQTPDFGVNTADGNVAIIPYDLANGKEWWINVTKFSFGPGWSFTLTGTKVESGKWDAWTEPGLFGVSFDALAAGLYKIDPSETVDYPGNARGIITVGDYMTKYYWRSGCNGCIEYTTSIGARGVWWVTSQQLPSGVGNVTFDSGMGPTRDGRTKPEIVAPGANIAAARAFNRPQRNSDPDNYHQIFRGTSFAAPHIAGVIALMLQMNPYLSPNQIITILTEDARQDRFTGTIDRLTGSNLWGWGKVNALKSTQDAISLYTATVEVEPLGTPLTTNLTLDGQTIRKISLNQTSRVVLEFRHGENHTLTFSPTIQVDSGTRYGLAEEPWTFSAGGVRKFHYQLQYLLQVKSAYANPTGTGWYNANSTAVASVVPSVTEGYEFVGWIGAISSDSPTVQVRMDSSKEIVAVWKPVNAGLNMANIIGVALAIAISVAIALVVRYKLPKRNRAQSS